MTNRYWAAGLLAGALTIGASAAVLKTAVVNPAGGAAQVATADVLPTTAASQPLLGISSIWPLTTPLPAPSTPVAASTSASAQTSAAASRARAPRKLPPLDLSTMWLWNWGGTWIGSEWTNGNSPIPWKFDHIQQPAAADTLLTLNAAGAPQIQGGGATSASNDGLWETDVTLPKLRDGLVVAPLWIYDPASRDEIDFEFAGRKGLDVSLHAYVNGVHQQNTVRLFAGTDMSGQRKRFGIKVDQASGYIEMYLDGKLVHRWDRASLGYFVSHPMKPWIEMWAANPGYSWFVQWVGGWTPLATGQTLTMRVHGYGYTTLAGQVVR